MALAEEIGKTVRLAMKSWHYTSRLCVLLAAVALTLVAFLAIRAMPLLMW